MQPYEVGALGALIVFSRFDGAQRARPALMMLELVTNAAEILPILTSRNGNLPPKVKGGQRTLARKTWR
jgi:hypothetical protein